MPRPTSQTRTRIVSLLLIVIMLFGAGLWAFHGVQTRQMKTLMQMRQTEQAGQFDRLLKLKSTSLRSYAYDYSGSNEMVRFLETMDGQWAHENIDQTALRFNVAAVWVFAADFAPIYAMTSLDDIDAEDLLPLAPAEVQSALKASASDHFFANTARGLLEFSAAPIQPAFDTVRATSPRGYFLAARLWDRHLVKEFAELADSEVTIRAAGTPGALAGSRDGAPGYSRFQKTAHGWDGSTVAVIDVDQHSMAIQKWHRSLNAQLVLFLAFAVLLLTTMLHFLGRWLSRPLQTISRALNEQDGRVLADLQDDATEFGRVSRLIRESFAQRQELVAEIDYRRQLQSELLHLASHDVLTGLPNRSLFRERLEQGLLQARRRTERLAVLYVDLDLFKHVNDTLGHEAGDQVLKEVAQRLLACVRDSDTVARVGGDEYLVCLSNVQDYEDATLVAAKIIETLSQPLHASAQETHVGASVGVSLFPDDGKDAGTLIRHADGAMYRAKELGRNNYQLFDAAVRERTAKRLNLQSGLRKALERNELELHYQPRANLASGRIIGVEALLRWRHPESGLLDAVAFMPIAEESGLIVPIGEWVLRTACRQLPSLITANGSALRVSVNVCQRQIRQQGFADMLGAVLGESGVRREDLELELTEGLLLHNLDIATGTMRELAASGVAFAIDDFGAGYSSLSQLKRLPIASIKIDGSLVRDLATDPDDSKLVAAMIGMAHGLHLKVVAEGVETMQQAEILRALGCTEAQGFHICRPLPAEQLDGFLRASRLRLLSLAK